MYRYRYVPVEGEGSFFTVQWGELHRQTIDTYAAQGWRYVGWFPSETRNDGTLIKADLIFEQETGEDQDE